HPHLDQPPQPPPPRRPRAGAIPRRHPRQRPARSSREHALLTRSAAQRATAPISTPRGGTALTDRGNAPAPHPETGTRSPPAEQRPRSRADLRASPASPPVNTDRPAAPPARGAADQKAGGKRLSRAATTNHRERDDDRAPGGARRRRRRPRERERRRKAARRTGSALGHLLLQVLVQRGEEFLGGQPLLVLADEQRQVLGHLAA